MTSHMDKGERWDSWLLVDGKLVSIQCNYPPRPLGDCCIHAQIAEGIWQIDVCEKHGAEIKAGAAYD